eukprot:TRINITY_DN2033_c0_g1_i2.p1 TRINITY_DN2033_c0_g1~~TRINITY_DN2033_c0_g1_i2.p1  ORF type:complete len:346 (+),score=14.79 TRINITY_DN2033_c0_g1_i2:11-1048(+)
MRGYAILLIICTSLVNCFEPHPCTLGLNCKCTTIYDSDCYCSELVNGTVKEVKLMNKTCACAELYKSCWNSSRSILDYNISHCPMPLLEKVDVNILTASMNSAGASVLVAWKEVLELFHEVVNFKIYFNQRERQASEMETDRYVLCAEYLYSDIRVYFPFVYCLSLHRESPSKFYQDCALGYNLNYTRIKECATGDKGKELLEISTNEIGRYSVVPTVFMDHRLYNPKSSRETYDYVKAMCYVFSNPVSDTKLFPWWVFSFMICVATALLLVIWVAKSDSYWGLVGVFCNVFYDIPEQEEQNNDIADEVMRRWMQGNIQVEEEEDLPSPRRNDNNDNNQEVWKSG